MRPLCPTWTPFGGLVLVYNGAARCGHRLLGWLGVGRELRLARSGAPPALIRAVTARSLAALDPAAVSAAAAAAAAAARRSRLLGAFHVPLDVRHAQEKLIAHGQLRQQLLLALRRAVRRIPALALKTHPARL